jgi:hypothetical protein
LDVKRRARPGEALATFTELAALETDECVLWPFSTDRRGYGKLNLNGKLHIVTRLALAQREREPSPGLYAAHGPCRNPTCMNYRHLRWATARENAADTLRDGTRNRGARNGQALLSPDDVRQIRSMLQGGMTCTAIGRAFGVALETVFQIKTNKNWGWLP